MNIKDEIRDIVYPVFEQNSYEGTIFSLLDEINKITSKKGFKKDSKVYLALDKYDSIQGISGVMANDYYNYGISPIGTRDEAYEITILDFKDLIEDELNLIEENSRIKSRLFFGINPVIQIMMLKGNLVLQVPTSEF